MPEENTYPENMYMIYVDDDPDDLFLVTDAIRYINPSITMLSWSNGQKALDFLHAMPMGKRLPGIILLDMNMPIPGGLEILATIKKDTYLHTIPVIIFTNSDHPRHIEEALSKGAAQFITKPYDNENLLRTCAVVAAYAGKPAMFKHQALASS